MIFIKYKIVCGKVKNGIIIADPDGLTIQMEITGKKHLWKEKDHGKMGLWIGQELSYMIPVSI
jgi:hypothetical protein